MAPESMVHALGKCRQLLEPHGLLVDIHPREEPRPIEIRIADQVYPAGWLQETDDYIEYVQATEAVAQAIQLGWFVGEREAEFRYTYYADTIVDLRDHLAENSKHAIVDDLVVMRAQDLMRNPHSDQEVMMHIPVTMARLRALP